MATKTSRSNPTSATAGCPEKPGTLLLLLFLLIMLPQPLLAATTLLSESFTDCTLPTGWAIENLGGTCVWEIADDADIDNATGGTGCFALADSDFCGEATSMNTALVSPAIDCSGITGSTLSFNSDFWKDVSPDSGASAIVSVSTDNGTTWTTVWQQNNNDQEPKSVTIDTAAAVDGQAVVQIRFQYLAPVLDYSWQVDDIVLSGTAVKPFFWPMFLPAMLAKKPPSPSP